MRARGADRTSRELGPETRLILRSGRKSAFTRVKRYSPASRRMRRPVALLLRDGAHASRVYPTCTLNPPPQHEEEHARGLVVTAGRVRRHHDRATQMCCQREVVLPTCFFPVPPCYSC